MLQAPHTYFLSERVLSETHYELPRRATRMIAGGAVGPRIQANLALALRIVAEQTTVISTALLRPHEQEARLRIPRDPDDWELVAVALLTGADIWTNDADFLGCGLVTWATDVLHALHPPPSSPPPAPEAA